MSCVWNANGSFTCDRVCDNSSVICRDIREYYTPSQEYTYSLNIIVTNADFSTIYYTKILPGITSSSKYVLDIIHVSDLFVNNNIPVVLQILDMTNYSYNIPLLQLLIVNSRKEQIHMHFNSVKGLNLTARTAYLNLPSLGPTQVILDRFSMNI